MRYRYLGLLAALVTAPAYAADPIGYFEFDAIDPPLVVERLCRPTLTGGCVKYLDDHVGTGQTPDPYSPPPETPTVPETPETPEPEEPEVPTKPDKPTKPDRPDRPGWGHHGKHGHHGHHNNHSNRGWNR